MRRQKSIQNIFTSSMGTNARTTVLSSGIRPMQRIALVWLDVSIDESNSDCQNCLAQLQSNVYDINIFTLRDECIDFLTEIDNRKAFLVVEGTIGQHIVPLIHDIPRLDTIHILCGDTSQHEQWTKEWTKIKGVHTDTMSIYQALQTTTNRCNQNSIAVSFIKMPAETSDVNLNQLEPSFMYTQIFKKIFLEMKHDEKSIKNLANHCRKLFNSDLRELSIVDEFERDYRSKSPIWWYTRPCFIYQTLNRALRTIEADTIIKMGFFIRDLHQQIEQLHQEQMHSYHGNLFTAYRGQSLLRTDFEKLIKTKGGLMSFNNFLSTSKDRVISFCFAEVALAEVDVVGILFQISIDPSVLSTPFASIKDVSYYDAEEEILFSMHAVFRVVDITSIDNNNLLYQVHLELTSDDDLQLRTLTERIREEIAGETEWKRLGRLLIKLSQFDKAEELYKTLVEQTSDESEKALYYNQLGYIKCSQGIYELAIWYFEKGLEICQKTLPQNHPDLATSYSNIGVVYKNMGEYIKALSFYEKGLSIDRETLPSNHPSLAISYNNVGEVYESMGEHLKALSSHEKALAIRQKSLPANHPHLASSYNNIGEVYKNMREYSKALSYHEKALAINQTTLLQNHPHVATSYNNIGTVYEYMGDYVRALSYYEKALEILQNALPPDHPHLASSYNNIGEVYKNMQEYQKALLFHERALEIYQKALPSNHFHLSTSYNNIGAVYEDMQDYSRAIPYYEKALEIRQSVVPLNHPHLATSYDTIGRVYESMGEHSKALSFYEKAIAIRRNSLPPNHPDFAASCHKIGTMFNNIGNFSKALSYYECALDIRQCSLPPNHPHLEDVRQSIEIVKKNLETII